MKVKADINIPLISLDYIYFLFNCILLTLRPHTDLNMKQQYIALILFLLSLFVAHSASAQIKGVVTDSLTNEPLMYITVQYEGKGVGAITNAEGEYTVETRKGWNELSFSAIGYVTKKVPEAYHQSTECEAGTCRRHALRSCGEAPKREILP